MEVILVFIFRFKVVEVLSFAKEAPSNLKPGPDAACDQGSGV
jgi:hypothetical protein